MSDSSDIVELPGHLSKSLFRIPEMLPPYFDKYLGTPVIFSLIVLFQGCFGSMGIIKVPMCKRESP